jgi:hypothetical protein
MADENQQRPDNENQQRPNNEKQTDKERRREQRRKVRGAIWGWTVDNRWLVTITLITSIAVGLWALAQCSACKRVVEAVKVAEDQKKQKAAAAKAAASQPQQGAGAPADPKQSPDAAEAKKREDALEKKREEALEARKQQCIDEVTGEISLSKLNVPLKIVLIVLAVLIGWFLDAFTGKPDCGKVDHMVAFCYVFPFALLAGILTPLFAFPVALPDPPKPIGIILGCNERPTVPLDKDLVPDGIRCFNRSDQYLVNIGGNAEEISEEEQKAREDELRAAAKGATEAQRPPGRPKTPPEGDEKGKSQKPKPQEKPAGEQQPGAEQTTENTRAATGTSSRQEPFQQVEPHRKRHVITGGLVIPLYFVIIAIFGGFVSMLRRVPEYQERVANASDPLTVHEAREKLVFEVLQLLAAPLIAITAYYIVDPSSRATSIVLAFIAGFSSETVLMYIRALAEKIQPPTTRTTPQVEVTPAALDFGKQAVNTTSAARPVRVTNRSGTAWTGTVTITAEFACTPLTLNIASGQTASLDVTFTPKTAGKKTGELQINDNARGSPRIVQLSGEGTGG